MKQRTRQLLRRIGEDPTSKTHPPQPEQNREDRRHWQRAIPRGMMFGSGLSRRRRKLGQSRMSHRKMATKL